MSRLALTLDGLQVSTSPKALLALLAHPVSKTPICFPHTHLLRKAGADLVLPDHLDLLGSLWDTLLKDGSHLTVRVSRLMDLVHGTIMLSLLAYQSAHKVHKGLPVCRNSNSSSGTRLACPRILWGLRGRTGQHPLVLVRTSPTTDKLLSRCRQSLTCTAKPHLNLR